MQTLAPARVRAQFVSRDQCIACGRRELSPIARGCFGDQPLRGFLERDPWAVSPMPYVEDATWEYVSCSCGQTFHRYVLAPEWQERRFSEWMGAAVVEFGRQRGSETFGMRFLQARRHVTHLLRLKELTRARGDAPLRLLDFGCGWGRLPALAALFGVEAVGLDRDPHRRAGATFRLVADLDELAGQRFHAITLFEVLEHLEDPLAILRALYGHMLPGGVLVLETPNCEGVREIRSEWDYRHIHPLDHINGFTPRTLRALARHAGFREIPRPAAHVTTSPFVVAKSMAGAVRSRLRPNTQAYFKRPD